MSAVRSVVIVGGGISGLSLAIGLARAAIKVEVLEASEDGNVCGIGMALQAPALHALDSVGLLQACIGAGFVHETATQISVDGALIRSQPIPRQLGESLPGQLCIDALDGATLRWHASALAQGELGLPSLLARQSLLCSSGLRR